MKTLFRIFLSLSILLIHGFNATPVAARQLVLYKKVLEYKAVKNAGSPDYKAANEFPSMTEGEVEDSDNDFAEDTEVEDDNDDYPVYKKYGSSANYFCAFYDDGNRSSLRSVPLDYSDDARDGSVINARYILFRVFRI